MIFELYKQKYLEKSLLKIEFGAVHQTGKIQDFIRNNLNYKYN